MIDIKSVDDKLKQILKILRKSLNNASFETKRQILRELRITVSAKPDEINIFLNLPKEASGILNKTIEITSLNKPEFVNI